MLPPPLPLLYTASCLTQRPSAPAQMALVLTGMTWTLLLPSAYSLPDAAARAIAVEGICNFGSYNQHGGNVVFMLGELFLAHLPFQSRYLGWVGVWTALYFLFESFSKIVWDQ